MQVSKSSQNQITIVRVRGQINTNTAPTLEGYLQEILDAGVSRLILDLGEATYVNSSGLRVMFLICRAARQAEDGGDLLIARPSQVIAHALAISGFDQAFRVYDSVDEALAGF